MAIQFLKKAITLIILTAIICALFLLSAKPFARSTNEYVAASIDKEKRLASLPSPKMVFTGGSNLSFGLNSEQVSKVFHSAPRAPASCCR